MSILNWHDETNVMNALRRSQAVIEFDLKGQVLKANNLFCDLMGYTEAEILGRNHSMFLTREAAESEAYRDLWQNLRSGRPDRQL